MNWNRRQYGRQQLTWAVAWLLGIGLGGLLGCGKPQPANVVAAPAPPPVAPPPVASASAAALVADDEDDDYGPLDDSFEAIQQEHAQAESAFFKAYEAAKSVEQKAELVERFPRVDRYARRMLRLAKREGGEQAFSALGWVVTQPADRELEPLQDRAVRALVANHLDNPLLVSLFDQLTLAPGKASETLLRAVVEQGTSREVKGYAAVALAKILKEGASALAQVPQWRGQRRQLAEATLAPFLVGRDPDALTKEATTLFERVRLEFGDVAAPDGSLEDVAEKGLFALQHLAVGKPAPEIEGVDVNGISFKLSDYRGKVVVLDFWGQWCPHCVAMYPHERAVVKRLAEKPFALLGINSDESTDVVKTLVDNGEITWRFWCDGKTPGPISGQWNITIWPAIFVLDKQGVIRFKDVRDDDLDAAIELLLAEPAANVGRVPQDQKSADGKAACG